MARAGRHIWGVLATVAALAVGCGGGQGPTGGGDGDGDKGKPGPGKPLKLEFFVENDSASADRTETVDASVPFPEGRVKELSKISIQDHWTSWRTLQKWADGSVKVAQAQFTSTFPAGKRRTFKIVEDSKAASDPFEPHPWTKKADGKFGIVAEVIDDYGVSYYAIPDASAKTLHSSRHSETKFWRLYLHNVNKSLGIKRDFMACRLYITSYRDQPFMNVEITIGGDYRGADNPKNSTDPNDYALGPVHFKKLMLHTVNGKIRMRQREKHGVDPVLRDVVNKRDTYTLLEDTWLDDGQTKLWNCIVFLDDETADQKERDTWNATWVESAERPLRPLATLASWQSTGALGIHGGPATGPADAYQMGDDEFHKWNGRNHFGPFGTWGDAQNTHQTGTPRNAPVSPQLANAIQGENPRVLAILEGMAWQQALRTFHVGICRSIPTWTSTCGSGSGSASTARRSSRRRRWDAT